MAKSPADPGAAKAKAKAPARVEGYLFWSRDPAVGLFAVLPLWLLYEGLRLWLSPAERNGAEVFLLRELDLLGWRGMVLLRLAFAGLLLVSAISLLRRDIPWGRVAGLVVLEGMVYGLLLGPVAAAMTSAIMPSSYLLLDVGGSIGALAPNLIGSLGAGIFEELLFRLGLMSLLAWFGMRLVTEGKLSRTTVGWIAVLGSAFVFSWFHHFCGEPFDRTRFLFRAMAGVLLGVLMWWRGYGVCVYTHTLYDVYYYLTREA